MIRFWWIALLSASISGSIATAVLMLIRCLLRFFKKEQPLLFAGCLALALYLFPFALLFPQKGLSLSPIEPNLSSGVLPFVEPFSPALTESSLTFAFLSPAERILEMLPFVWLLIFLLLAFRCLCKNFRFARYLSRKRISCREGEAYTAPGREIPVYQIPMPCSPFAYGLFHPAIYLPEGHRLSKSALQLVLRHESTHIRQKHLWIKAAAQLAAMLHWFCPFVWLMKAYLEDACEIRCDHTVTAAMNGGERKRYAQLLLEFAEMRGGSGNSFSVAGKQLARRICALRRKADPFAAALSGIAAALLLIFAPLAALPGSRALEGVSGNMAMLREALVHTRDFIPLPEGSEGSLTAPQDLAAFSWPFPEYRYCSRMQTTGAVIAAEEGSYIYAPADGVVLAASDEGSCTKPDDFGLTLVLLHSTGPDISTSFSHCKALYVVPGQMVRQGQCIGILGQTPETSGVLCRFQIRIDGALYSPSHWFPNEAFSPGAL